MGGGKVEVYLDIASYYSYIAYVQVRQIGEFLRRNGVEIVLHPVLIGGINVGSGNAPPWKVPAKARYGKYDMRRAADAVGLKDVSPPGDLMVAGKTLLPMRALTHIRTAFPPDVYVTAFGYLFHAFWTLHRVPNDAATLADVLAEIPADFGLDCFVFPHSPHSPSSHHHSASSSSSHSTPSSVDEEKKKKKLFTPEQISRILFAATSDRDVKDALKARVDEALARDAFGAPWVWVTPTSATDAGTAGHHHSEPFFGSDRWHWVCDFLGVPRPPALLAPLRGEKKEEEVKASL
ncbi:thioredoxin-like protein [Xylariaceae sp. FL0594]|nr:thioredoxin-like protein [Xylariaceae sp. FL0594]